MSINIGEAPALTMLPAVAKKVKGGDITQSSEDTPKAFKAI